MSFTQRKTPARLASPAAKKLPRKILFWVMIVYTIAGLFGRDPWKTDDVMGFASMLSTLESEHWLGSYVDFRPYVEHGPLTSIIGAAAIYLFSPVFELFTSSLNAQIMASRLPNLLYVFTMLWGIWYGTYLLARRPETQPLPLPFGGEPNPKDYGRMLADVAFLLLIATVGIVIRIHETSFFPLLLAIHALAFYGFVRLLDHPTQATFVLGITMALAFLTRGFIGLAPLLVVVIGLFITRIYTLRQKVFLFLALMFATLLCAVWAGSIYTSDLAWLNEWWQGQMQAFSLQHWAQIPQNLRDLAWFLWPSWPFALLALWNWRHWFDKAHIFIPTAFIVGNLLLIFSTEYAFEPEYGPMIIGCVALAAMAIPTLKRSVINLLDWYSIMVVSLILITVWLGWFALYFGYPTQIHRNIMRLLNGFDTAWNLRWFAGIVAGLVICVFWVHLVKWRLGRNPQAMWRGIVLSAAGTTATWLLLASLWLPAINYNRSYVKVSESLAQVLQEKLNDKACVRVQNIGEGQRAAFYAFAHLQGSQDKNCRFVFLQTTQHNVADKTYPYAKQSKVVWQGQRASERHGEWFMLLELSL